MKIESKAESRTKQKAELQSFYVHLQHRVAQLAPGQRLVLPAAHLLHLAEAERPAVVGIE